MENNTLILPDGRVLTTDESGYYRCPNHMHIHCKTPKCDRCGWDPKVAARRRYELKRTKGFYQRIDSANKKPKLTIWKQGGAGQ